MTTAALTPSIEYIENGATLVYAVPFRFRSPQHVAASRVDAAGVVTNLSYGADYSVTGGTTDTGGALTVVAAGVAGTILRIKRVTPRAQTMDYTTGDTFPAESHEAALDVAMLIDQEQDQQIADTQRRALLVPDGEIAPLISPKSIRGGKFPLWSLDGTQLLDSFGPGTDLALRQDLATGPGGSIVKYLPSGTGAVPSDIQAELRRIKNAGQYGTVGDGIVDEITAITNARIACQTGDTDGPGGRSIAQKLIMPPGRFRIQDVLQLAPANGLVGFALEGSGRGVTTFVYTGAASAIACRSSRAFSMSNCTLEGLTVDTDQTAIIVAQVGNPLRSWSFDKVDFVRFWKCFDVTGASMCSEVVANECGFYQCYYGMVNSNDQAVNWTFQNCNWEQESLDTVKDVGLSAVFKLNKGSFVTWRGGSIIPTGRLLYFTPSGSGVYPKTSHRYNFENIRIELLDIAGTHVPIIDRQDLGYASGSNGPVVTIRASTMLFRGAIPANITIARIWANCKFTFEDIECEGGKVVGILDGVTPNQAASLFLRRAGGVTYEADTTARLNTHDQHYVVIEPDNSASGTVIHRESKQAGSTVPFSTRQNVITFRTESGSVPLAGTTFPVPAMHDHAILQGIRAQRFEAAAQSLTVELKDAADTTVYQSFTMIPADRTKDDYTKAKEMGFQIPSGTPLMIKLTGVAEIVKGYIALEYIG
jgi:hypothetical protein